MILIFSTKKLRMGGVINRFLLSHKTGSMSTTMENDALVVGANAVLTHADFTMDISNVIRMG